MHGRFGVENGRLVSNSGGQIVFGVATATVYGLLSHAGIVFGLFFSLCLTCAGRGALMWVQARRFAEATKDVDARTDSPAGTQNA